MNKTLFFLLGSFVITLAGCSPSRFSPRHDVVCQNYYHTYGVEVSEDEWRERGSNGEITRTLDNGITERRSFKKGVPHGLTTYTFPHSSLLEREEVYHEGTLTKRVIHYPSGTPYQCEEWPNQEEYAFTTWYEDGTPLFAEYYNENLLVSGEYFPLHHDEPDTIITNGDGIRTLRDHYGLLLAKEEFHAGERTLTTEYYPTGTPKRVTPYAQRKIEGERKLFLPGGEPHTIEKWTNGIQEGTTLVFENGALQARIPYKKGKKHGVEKHYDLNNNVVEEITWEGGKRQGPTHIVVRDHVKTEWYYDDQLVSKASYEAQIHPFVY